MVFMGWSNLDSYVKYYNQYKALPLDKLTELYNKYKLQYGAGLNSSAVNSIDEVSALLDLYDKINKRIDWNRVPNNPHPSYTDLSEMSWYNFYKGWNLEQLEVAKALVPYEIEHGVTPIAAAIKKGAQQRYDQLLLALNSQPIPDSLQPSITVHSTTVPSYTVVNPPKTPEQKSSLIPLGIAAAIAALTFLT